MAGADRETGETETETERLAYYVLYINNDNIQEKQPRHLTSKLVDSLTT
jgi:hypothetical protein